MSHKESVLKHIQSKGYITSWEAIRLYKDTRLSGTIYVLRNEGIDIKMKMFINPKTKTCYGVYYIKDKELKKYEQGYKRLLRGL